MLPHRPARRNLDTVVEFILVTDIPQDPPGPGKQPGLRALAKELGVVPVARAYLGLLPPLPDEADPDAVFARRVRQLRESAGLTQRQVADQMTGAGYRMHQTTIAKIEADDPRPVYVGEAVTLARILGVSLSDLLSEPTEVDERQLADARIAVAALAHQQQMLQARLAEAQETAVRLERDLERIEAEMSTYQRDIALLTERKDGRRK
jgi:transcriptional regulator with XRE-family HTH domain